MIEWCRAPDQARWIADFQRRWAGPLLAPGRPVTVLRVRAGSGGQGWLQGSGMPRRPPPGGRLVLAVQWEVGADTPAWLEVWRRAGLVPEVMHRCEPVPGTPSFSYAGLDASGVTTREGLVTAGCVLARRLTAADLIGVTLQMNELSAIASEYFPPAAGDRIPCPLEPGPWSINDVARAYGVDEADAPELADELVWSGVVTLGRVAQR